MLRLTCPHCGERDHAEFTYGGDATKARPSHGLPAPAGQGPAGPAGVDQAAWYGYVYTFDNPKGLHREYWQHTYGCRHWMVVERHTVTHQVTGCWQPAETPRPAPSDGAGRDVAGEPRSVD